MKRSSYFVKRQENRFIESITGTGYKTTNILFEKGDSGVSEYSGLQRELYLTIQPYRYSEATDAMRWYAMMLRWYGYWLYWCPNLVSSTCFLGMQYEKVMGLWRLQYRFQKPCEGKQMWHMHSSWQKPVKGQYTNLWEWNWTCSGMCRGEAEMHQYRMQRKVLSSEWNHPQAQGYVGCNQSNYWGRATCVL